MRSPIPTGPHSSTRSNAARRCSVTLRGTLGCSARVVHAASVMEDASASVALRGSITGLMQRSVKRTPPRTPVLGKHRVADVVAPPPADFHVASRESLALEFRPLHQRERAVVGRLD